jgi:hypothetical protein
MGKSIVVLLVLGALIAATTWRYGPGLLTDVQMEKKNLVIDRSLQVDQLDCNTRPMFVTMCTIGFIDRSVRPIQRKRLHYLLLGGSELPGIELMHPRGNRSLMVSSAGLDRLGSRISAFVLIVGGLAILFVLALMKAVGLMGDEAAAASA